MNTIHRRFPTGINEMTKDEYLEALTDEVILLQAGGMSREEVKSHLDRIDHVVTSYYEALKDELEEIRGWDEGR